MTQKSRAAVLLTVQCLYLVGCGQSGSKSDVEQLQKQVDSLRGEVQLIQQYQTNEMAAWRKSFSGLQDADGKLFDATSELNSNKDRLAFIDFILLSNRVTQVEQKSEMLRQVGLELVSMGRSNDGISKMVITNIVDISKRVDVLESNRVSH